MLVVIGKREEDNSLKLYEVGEYHSSWHSSHHNEIIQGNAIFTHLFQRIVQGQHSAIWRGCTLRRLSIRCRST
jgi:hypothetical protein